MLLHVAVRQAWGYPATHKPNARSQRKPSVRTTRTKAKEPGEVEGDCDADTFPNRAIRGRGRLPHMPESGDILQVEQKVQVRQVADIAEFESTESK